MIAKVIWKIKPSRSQLHRWLISSTKAETRKRKGQLPMRARGDGSQRGADLAPGRFWQDLLSILDELPLLSTSHTGVHLWHYFQRVFGGYESHWGSYPRPPRVVGSRSLDIIRCIAEVAQCACVSVSLTSALSYDVVWPSLVKLEPRKAGSHSSWDLSCASWTGIFRTANILQQSGIRQDQARSRWDGHRWYLEIWLFTCS